MVRPKVIRMPQRRYDVRFEDVLCDQSEMVVALPVGNLFIEIGDTFEGVFLTNELNLEYRFENNFRWASDLPVTVSI